MWSKGHVTQLVSLLVDE